MSSRNATVGILAAFVVLGLSFPVSAIASPAASRSESPAAGTRLRLEALDVAGLPPVILDTAMSQVVETLAGLGVAATWERGAEEPPPVTIQSAGRPASEGVMGSSGQMPVSISVVLTPSLPETWGLAPGAMGAVLDGSQPQDVVFVFPAVVSRVLGSEPRVSSTNVKAGPALELARALGRVVVHELIHAVAPDHEHAHAGIMLGHQNRDSLLGGATRVDSACARAFVRALAEIG